MAKNNSREEKLNYSAAVKELRQRGPERLYLLWGPEDYLRERYFAELKALCFPEGEDSFSYRRMDGPELDLDALRSAIDAPPFMAEKSLVELRGVDINRLKEPESYIALLSDIPDYCTLAFIQGSEYEPDGRLKLIKTIRAAAREIKFTSQPQGPLTDWIVKRFAAAGKSVELEAAQRLIFISGELMNRLIPEIDKVAAFAKGDRVSVTDVEAVASHIPEAQIFEMTDRIAAKEYNSAAAILSELLADKANEPIPMLAMLGMQMRRLYAARLAIEQKLGVKYVMEVCASKSDYYANRLTTAARGYTLPQLRRAVELCAETDYRIKSGSENDTELLKEAVMRIAAGETDAQR